MNKPDLPYIPDYLDQRLIALGLTPGQRLVADRVLRWTTWDTDAEEYVVHWPVTLKAAARLGVNKKLLTRTKEALSAKEEITQMSGANRAAGESEVWVVTKLIHEKKERN